MVSLLTAKTIRTRLKELDSVKENLLFRQVRGIGTLLAVHGFVDEAVRVWRLLYDMNVPEGARDVFGDSTIAAVCFAAGIDDFSAGRPLPSSLNGKENLPLSERVQLQHVRELATALVSPSVNFKAFEPSHPIHQFNAGLTAARAGRIDQALDDLQNSIQQSEAGPSGPTDACRVLPALHSIALAANQATRAEWALVRWYKVIYDRPLNTIIDVAFSYPAFTDAVCKGVFADRATDVRDDVEKLPEQVAEKISQALERYQQPPPKKHRLIVFYNQFYLEHKDSPADWEALADPAKAKLGFDFADGQLAIGTPGETGECDVELNYSNALPDLAAAQYALSLPLDVTDSRLYLHGIEPDTSMPFEVKPGKYDVLIQFRLSKRKHGSGMRVWNVLLTLMPQGTVGGAAVLKGSIDV